MPDRKYFVKDEQLISSTAPRDHVQFTHQGYRVFDDEESAKRHVAAAKAAATRAAKREAEALPAPATSARKAEWSAYAVRQGMSQARATELSKAQLVKEFTGGGSAQAATSTEPAVSGGDARSDLGGGTGESSGTTNGPADAASTEATPPGE